MSRLTFCLSLVMVAAAPPALADACKDRITAMFDGGPLDPFQRPAHRYVMTTTGPDGTVKSVYTAEFETNLRMIGWTEGNPMVTLFIGSDSWIRTSEDGDWMQAPNMVPEDHEGFQREQHAQMLANLDQTECPGMVELGGTKLENIRFFTKTDPTETSHNAWFGGMNSVFIDPETGQVMRWETSEMVSSFTEGVSEDLQVRVFTYDPDLKIERPE